eukprot:SAG31_NODE_3512_length_4172_cov_30.849251_6_plen_157_part_00
MPHRTSSRPHITPSSQQLRCRRLHAALVAGRQRRIISAAATPQDAAGWNSCWPRADLSVVASAADCRAACRTGELAPFHGRCECGRPVRRTGPRAVSLGGVGLPDARRGCEPCGPASCEDDGAHEKDVSHCPACSVPPVRCAVDRRHPPCGQTGCR